MTRDYQKGFTLVELMVALAISVFLIGGVLLMQSSARVASVESERLSRIQENLRFNSEYLVREMRNAGFRDQLSLTIAEYDNIATEFAAISDNGDDGDQITIRYSGRGHCAEGFDPDAAVDSAGVVENVYFVDGGELKCKGSLDGGAERTVSLATGIQSADFQFMCPDSNPGCSCSLWQHGDDFDQEKARLEDSCYGVRIGLTLEPVTSDADPVAVELSAVFRNIVLGKLMWNSVPAVP